MFCDVDHPNVSLSEWQTFLKDLPPHLIVEVIDRSKLGLPPWFVPFARGVAIASHALLREAGHRLGMHRPRGWLNSVEQCVVGRICMSQAVVARLARRASRTRL